LELLLRYFPWAIHGCLSKEKIVQAARSYAQFYDGQFLWDFAYSSGIGGRSGATQLKLAVRSPTPK
jgi:hypothetical protein